MLHRRILSALVPPSAKLGRPDADGYIVAVVGPKTLHCKRLADGSVRQVSSTWSWRQRANGKLKDRPTGCTDKTAAMSVVAGWQRQSELIKSGLITKDESERSQMPVKLVRDAVEEYLSYQAAKGVTAAWIADQRRFMARLVKDTNTKTVPELADRMPGWITDVTGELSPRNINAHVGTVISLLRWAMTRSDIQVDVTKVARIKKVSERIPTRPRRAMTEDEFQRLVSTAPPDRVIVYKIARGTGFRRGEIGKLSVTDFDYEARTLRLMARSAKNGTAATQPISQTLADEIRQHIGSRTSGPLVKISKSIGHRLSHDLKAAAITKIDNEGRSVDFHSLRRTFVTSVVASGVDVRTAQELARHKTVGMTLGIYAESSKTRLKDAVDRAFSGDTLGDIKVTSKGSESKTKPTANSGKQWAMRESNPRHPACKAGASRDLGGFIYSKTGSGLAPKDGTQESRPDTPSDTLHDLTSLISLIAKLPPSDRQALIDALTKPTE